MTLIAQHAAGFTGKHETQIPVGGPHSMALIGSEKPCSPTRGKVKEDRAVHM